jgi:capsular polysaccharide transport system permease protein
VKKKLIKIYIKIRRYLRRLDLKGAKPRLISKALIIHRGKNLVVYGGKVGRVFNYMRNHVFLSIVLLPWIVCAAYIVLFKSPVYESNAKVLVENSSAEAAMNINLGLLGGTDNSNVYLTKDYITSRDMMEHIDSKLSIINYYQSKNIDHLSRLKSNAKQKDRLEYYQNMVSVHFDASTKELLLSTRAYDAEFARKVLEEILLQTKVFVNRIANTLANDQYEFAEKQLKLAKQKLFDAEKKILAFQNNHGMFDPKQAVQVISDVMAQLKSKLVEKQTELITYSAFLRPKSSKVVALKQEIESLKKQIRTQTTSLLGDNQKKKKLNSVLIDFEILQLNLKFATAEYEAAQQAFDAAKMKMAKQQNLVIEIVSPNLPDDYAYPKISYELINIFIMLLILFGLLKMTIMVVEEHRD